MSLLEMAKQAAPASPAPAAASAQPAPAPSDTPKDAPAPAAPAEGEDAPKATGEEGANDFKTARPDGVPEKFWDADKGQINADGLLKSYTNLEKELTKAKEKPKAPEKYEYIPSETIIKDFPNIKISPDDPYIKQFQEHAKSKNFSQEQYQELVDWYVGTELVAGRQTQIAEMAKLGKQEEAVQRLSTIDKWGKTKFSEDEQAVLNSMIGTAEQVKLIEKIIGMTTGQRQLPTDPPAQIDAGLTQAELDDMMNDERYSNKRHPEYKEWNAKVSAAYARLYPDKKG